MVPVTPSPNVKALKSGLSMLLEEGAYPTSTISKKNLFTHSADDDFAASYGSVESFSDSFFEFSKKPVHLGASENTVSETSFCESIEIISIQDKEEKSEPVTPVTPITCNDQKPPKFGVTDLLTLLLDDIKILEKDKSDQSVEELDMIHGLAQITTDIMLTALLVLPAEEDGTPMDDLPSFSTKTELLSLGVKDFAVVDKASYEPLMHVRAEGNITAMDVMGRSQRATSQDRISTQDSNESSYYAERPSSVTNADTIQVFRMDSDESHFKLIKSDSLRSLPSGALTPINKPTEISGSFHANGTTPISARASRRRSFSFSFNVSYRFIGSEKWRFVKRAFVNPLTPLTTPQLKTVKSDFIPIIQQQQYQQSSNNINDDMKKNENNKNTNNQLLFIPTQQPMTRERERTNKVEAISINYSEKVPPQQQPLTPKLSIFSSSNKVPTLQTLTDSGLFRRHSEKTYQEEMMLRKKKSNHNLQDEKYSRNYSFSGEGMVSLNPHTSSSMMAQFSPSTHSSNPSREDSPTDFYDSYIPPLSNKYSSPTHRTQSPAISLAVNTATITPFSSPGRSKKELTTPSKQTANPSPVSGKSTSGRGSVGGNTNSSSSSILNIFRLF
mmetsp:Transcript_4931/g.5401  ORF Transcript_4931/g.5401 Transcript_4931/m.5401 type:complete len:613 (-) Transcript_4931:246-2084(-)